MNRNRDSGRQGPSEPGVGGAMPGGGLWRILIWVLLIGLVAPWLWNLLGSGASASEVSYSSFREQLEAGNIVSVTVSGEEIMGRFAEPVAKEMATGEMTEVTEFVTYVPSVGDDELMPLLVEQGVEVTTEPVGGFPWAVILLNALPLLLLLGLGYMFLSRSSRQGQSLFNMGQNRAKLYHRSQEATTFDDVAGAYGAKTELEEVIQFLKSPGRFERLGGEIPRGVLLVGPPGTGKTLLARAVAGEAGVPFFSISGSDFMEMFVSVGASRVRELFNDAKKVSPSIIFIDELDSIGRRRGAGVGGGHDEREQTLNQLLSEMDGFEPNENVIVMAATNRPDILDPALLRPGRFDRQITVDLPTAKSREEILAIHARNKPLADDVDLAKIARGTPGFSGADLRNLLNEAALLAAREGKSEIYSADIDEARDKVMMGLERENLALTDEELKLLAYHEAGHALVAAVIPEADPIHKVTIVPRGRAMGVTQTLPDRDKYVYSRDYMLDRMAVMMGGRAAENLVIGTPTSGAENDLKQATKWARKMVLDWGMSDRIGQVALGGDDRQVFLGEELGQWREFSELTAREIDEEVRVLTEEAYQRAYGILEERRHALDGIAEALLKHEEISGEMVLEIVGAEATSDEPDHFLGEEAERRLRSAGSGVPFGQESH